MFTIAVVGVLHLCWRVCSPFLLCFVFSSIQVFSQLSWLVLSNVISSRFLRSVFSTVGVWSQMSWFVFPLFRCLHNSLGLCPSLVVCLPDCLGICCPLLVRMNACSCIMFPICWWVFPVALLHDLHCWRLFYLVFPVVVWLHDWPDLCCPLLLCIHNCQDLSSWMLMCLHERLSLCFTWLEGLDDHLALSSPPTEDLNFFFSAKLLCLYYCPDLCLLLLECQHDCLYLWSLLFVFSQPFFLLLGCLRH